MTKNFVRATENSLTSAHEDYLKAIYLLETNGELVSNSALAQQMGFAPASTTNMVKKLAELHLVTHEPYRGVQLTPVGRQVALEVLRHHRLIELFLHEALNMPWDRVHEEADKLEHVISEAMEDAMAALLGNPTVDPHGDPIPSKEGHVVKTPGFPLCGAPIGEPLRLIRVLTQEPDRLCYLGSLGLYPAAQIVLRERAPLQGPLLVEMNSQPHALAHEMGECLQVVLVELESA